MAIKRDQAANNLSPISIFLFLAYPAKAQSVNLEGEEEKDEGFGMAEAIVIVVCLLVILAFILACVIMIRNTFKRQQMASEKMLQNEQEMEKSQQIQSHPKTQVMNGTAQPSSSSEYDSEDPGEEEEEVENFSAYSQQKKIKQQAQMDV